MPETIETARFSFVPTPLAGVWHVRRKPLGDARGAFARFYCVEEFRAIGVREALAQINHSFSARRGTVRGLHFQHPPQAETKVVSCLSGRIFDVVLDLRRASPTFLHWHAVELSAGQLDALVIPPGCAHGFQTLTDDCQLIYLHTVPHAPECEGGVGVTEPRLRPGPLHFPLPVSEMSPRDRNYPPLAADFEGLMV